MNCQWSGFYFFSYLNHSPTAQRSDLPFCFATFSIVAFLRGKCCILSAQSNPLILNIVTVGLRVRWEIITANSRVVLKHTVPLKSNLPPSLLWVENLVLWDKILPLYGPAITSSPLIPWSSIVFHYSYHRSFLCRPFFSLPQKIQSLAEWTWSGKRQTNT